MLAMKTPALFCSTPAPYPQCSCQMSSSPGDVRIVGIVCVPAPLRVPFCITATRGCRPCTSTGETRRIGAVMRNQIQIDRPERVVRAHQLELLVPEQIAEVDRAELSEGNHAADRLAILGIGRNVLRREGGTGRIGLAAPWQRGLQHAASG